MDVQKHAVEAIMAELRRQQSNPERGLRLEGTPPEVAIHGRVDLDKLAMAVAGALAGGP